MSVAATIQNLTITDGEFCAFDGAAGVTGAGKNLTVPGTVIVTAGKLNLDAGSSDGNATFGTLTINGGEVIAASAGSLTVSGITNVQGTLTCLAGAVSLGSGVTSNYGLIVGNTGTFTGGSGTHTIGMLYQTGGTVTFTSGTTTLNGKNTSGGFNFNQYAGTFNHGSGTVINAYT